MSTESKALSGTPVSFPLPEDGQGPLGQAKKLSAQGRHSEALQLLSGWSGKSHAAHRALAKIQDNIRADHGKRLTDLLVQLAHVNGAGSTAKSALDQLNGELEPGAVSFTSALQSLDSTQQNNLSQAIGASSLRQLKHISGATAPDEFWGDLYRFGLEKKATYDPKEVYGAQAVFAFIVGQESGVPEGILKKAQRELDALQGHGSTGATLENLTGNFVHQVTDVKMIAPMVLATPVFHATRAGALRFLVSRPAESFATRGLGANALASSVGFVGETTFFAMGSRGLMHALEGPVAWDAKSVGQDWLGAAMTLGMLKSVGFLGRRGTMWFKGLDEVNPAAWTKADHRTMFWASQSSGYLGLVAAHKMEEMAGLRKPTPGSHLMLDALSTHLALGVGGHLGRSVLGRRFAAYEQRLNRDAGTLYQVSKLSRARRGGLSPYEYLQKTLKDAFTFNGGGFPPGMQPMAVGAYGAMAPLPVESVTGARKIPSHVAAMVGDGPKSSGTPPSRAPGSERTPSSFPPKPLEGKYVVIGNRGEPAVRGVKTAKELGATPVVYVSEADRNALHASLDGVLPIHLKGNTSNETYNNIEARLGALAKLMEQKGIKPEQVVAWEGWGFKSEDSELFARHEALGFGIAGAPSRSHELMGDKVSARRVAQEAKVPVVPGSEEMSDLATAKSFAESIGFPVIIKGKDTGGGKGIRVALNEESFSDAFQAARREAESTSGSPAVFIEKFIPSMRHIEVQVVADGKGSFVVAGVRECSLQRNKQKVIEEDVSTFLDGEILDQAKGIASKLMGHKDLQSYKGPGTIEMIWDVSDNKLYFMEMNTRLQVEHTVTEMVTGRNLLKAQLELGAGLPLSFTKVNPKGHAIEVRITSEDPYDNFRPSTGKILHYREPESHKTDRIIVRVDSGVEANREISEHYDSMIAKLVVWGQSRMDAIEGLQKALSQFEILGVKTNIPFLKALVDTPEFQEARWGDTRFIEEIFLNSEAGKPNYKDQQEAIITAAVQTYLMRKKPLLKTKDHILNGSEFKSQVELEFNGQKYDTEVFEVAPNRFMVRVGDSSAEVGVRPSNKFLYNLEIDGEMRRSLIKAAPGSREVLIDNVSYPIKVHGEGDLGPGNVVSQMPGKVVAVKVKPGDKVKAGDPVVVVEAMKMENSILADISGEVKSVEVQENGQVAAGQKMVVIEAAGEAADSGAALQAQPVGFDRAPSILSRVVSQEGKPNFQDRRQVMDYATRFFDGYGSPPELLRQALAKVKPSGIIESSSVERTISHVADAVRIKSPYVHFNKDLQAWMQGMIDRFIAVESIFQPAHQKELVHFLQTGEVEKGPFADSLERALKFYGVASTDPSPELNEAVFRLHQSHEQRREKAKVLVDLLPWIPKFKMTELESALRSLQSLYVSGVPATFQTEVATTRQLLQKYLSSNRKGPSVEQDFEQLLKHGHVMGSQAERDIFSHGHEVVPYLLHQAQNSRDQRRQFLSLSLLQSYLFGNRYLTSQSQWEGPGVLTQFLAPPGSGIKGVRVLSMALGQKDQGLQPALGSAMEALQRVKFDALSLPQSAPPSFSGIAKFFLPKGIQKLLGPGLPSLPAARLPISKSTDRTAIEILLPERPTQENLKAMESLIGSQLANQNIDWVTLIIPKEDGMPDFRTYHQDPKSGEYVENTILRNIHPTHARDIQLDRWTPNFDLTRQDFGLFDHVHAYRAVEKNPKNAKTQDQRHFVIGEHRGTLTYEKFDSTQVKNRLLNDFRKFKNQPGYELDSESQVVWSWLPYALKEVGELSDGFDPFSIGVLKASPKELIHRFALTESQLEKAAEFYNGKVKTIPEVEKVAKETSLVMQHLQRSQGSKGSLPANANIFIQQPVEMTDSEIKLMAFRLTPGFMGQRIEKTTVHFNRRVGNIVRPFIAEVKIPGQTRFEVVIKPGLENPPAHQPRSSIDRKRVIQQGRGKQYVYDRVALFEDVLHDFYPLGNMPADAIKIQEMVLDGKGGLVPTDRAMGQNDIGKVAFKVGFKIPRGASDQSDTFYREFMVIADDYTFMAGSQGTREGELYKAVSDYAIQHGLPKLYLAESSGARIGFAKELKPFIHLDEETGGLYVRSTDLGVEVGKAKVQVESLIQTGEAYQVVINDGGIEKSETRYPLKAIIGEGQINTESLNASGLSGESESRARANIPTATITFGTTIGISTYLARLSEFVIMVENSFLGLTGRNAINNTFGSNYRSELEVAGPKIMTQNGVAYKVVPGERDALKSYLQWLSYQPQKAGAGVPQLETSDPVSRDVGPEIQALIPGKGQKYDTKQLDDIIFDKGSVWYVQDDGDPMYGRYVNTGFATIGGTPVGILSMEMNPKMKPGEKQVYPGGLDPESSNKVAQHIRNVNQMGLPLIFNSSITGFMPRHIDHLEGVIPGGARILDALREFDQAAIMWVPPHGFLYGGAWVVIDKNINPNVTMVADHTAQMGILGAQAANDLPLVARTRKSGEEYKLTKLMLDAQNTPQRAKAVGSIHEVIENTGETRLQLHRLLTDKMQEVEARRTELATRAAAVRQVESVLSLVNIDYEIQGNEVVIHAGSSMHRIPLSQAQKGLQQFLGGVGNFDLMNFILVPRPEDKPE